MIYEWRSALKRVGPPHLAERAPPNTQFRSVYGFPPATCARVRAQKTMKNLSGCIVFSDTLLIDIDKDENIPAVTTILNKLNIQYYVFTTGNRGAHIHIPIEPMTGVNVIYSQRQWLKSVGLWSLVDTSIYIQTGQFRAVGAVHRKTGKIKELTSTTEGSLLTIKMLIPPPVVHTKWDTKPGTSTSEYEFYINLLAWREIGKRHLHLYILWKAGKSAGLEREELIECLRWWNDTCCEQPHTEQALNTKIRGFK